MIIGIHLTPLDAAAILIVLAATLGYINARFLKLPASVGMTLMGAVASLIVIGLDRLLPGSEVARDIVGFIGSIDFHATLMDGMLSFLLFAGALHIDVSEMKRGRWPVLILSTAGVVLSTVLIGFGFQWLAGLFGFAFPIIWCLVFGALISPTDPVAVLQVLKRTNVPPTLQATVAGESLFNDGVGVVVFTIVLAMALGTGDASVGSATGLFALEAGGGVLLGLAIGWLAYQAMRTIDDYTIEVMVSLAVVMGGYTVARWLHISGPVAMAVAGLLVGNHAVQNVMSNKTQDYLLKFWSVIDELLNAILFLLIGLEVITIPRDPRLIAIGLCAIPLALSCRAIAVLVPLTLLRPFLTLGKQAPLILIWGGLRGGISLALALALPEGIARSAALTATYAVVLFAVIVQGGSIGRLLQKQPSQG